MNPGITWMLQHYEPGTKTSDGGAVFPCRVCAAQVVDSGDALERHVKWHETLITTNATYIMRAPQL